MPELTKSDRRKCRELIHIGLERECKGFYEKIQKYVNKPLPEENPDEPYLEENGIPVEGPWHKRYIAMFRMTRNFDKLVARRYNRMTPSNYLGVIVGLLVDEVLTEQDISCLPESIVTYLIEYKRSFEKDIL